MMETRDKFKADALQELQQFIKRNSDPRELKRALAVHIRVQGVRPAKIQKEICDLLESNRDDIELHHRDGDHNNWKPKNLVALHREGHQHQPVHSDCVKRGKSKSRSRTKRNDGAV